MDLYRERLCAAPWLFISTALVIPRTILVLAPINVPVGIVVSIVFYLAIVVALIAVGADHPGDERPSCRPGGRASPSR